MKMRPDILMIGMVIYSPALAADMLPIDQGVFVSSDVECKGASNAATLSYGGGRKSLNSSKTDCSINKMSKKGNYFSIRYTCADLPSNSEFNNFKDKAPFVIKVIDSKHIKVNGQDYRYCSKFTR